MSDENQATLEARLMSRDREIERLQADLGRARAEIAELKRRLRSAGQERENLLKTAEGLRDRLQYGVLEQGYSNEQIGPGWVEKFEDGRIRWSGGGGGPPDTVQARADLLRERMHIQGEDPNKQYRPDEPLGEPDGVVRAKPWWKLW